MDHKIARSLTYICTILLIIAAILLSWHVGIFRIYTYNTQNAGIVINLGNYCLGYEWKGYPGFFNYCDN